MTSSTTSPYSSSSSLHSSASQYPEDTTTPIVPVRILQNRPKEKKKFKAKQVLYIALAIIGALIAAYGGLTAAGMLPLACVGGSKVGAYCLAAFGGAMLIAGGLLFWFSRR